jgi:hypothetical protein
MPRKKADEMAALAEKPKSKSQRIREALEADPQAMPKALADALNAEGLSVSANEVSQAKYLMKQATKKRGPKAKAKAEVAAAPAAGPASDLVSVAALQKAKKLIQELGGVAEAKQALQALAQLLD